MTTAPKPNLFLIGAMKSGTSSLHSYLGEHPSIFMCQPKEPSYFVERSQLRELYPEMEKRGYWREERRYLDLFRAAGARPIIGESSTNYSKLPKVTGVVDRLRQFNPEARVIYIMRDPIERTISHYWHNTLHHNERRPMLDAIREDPHYREVSHYAMQLSPYISLWASDRLRVLTLEELNAKPVDVIQGVFRWLGVDDSFVPAGLAIPQHTTPDQIRQARGWSALIRLRDSLIYQAIRPMLPAQIRGIGTSLTRRTIERQSASCDETIRYLRPLQESETGELSALLDRDFPEWTTLRA